MKIKTRDLFGMVKPDKYHSISPASIASIVRNVYCARMTVRDLCPQACDRCKGRILHAFEFATAPRIPEALLTWRLKEAVAQAADEVLEQKRLPQVKKDAIGSVLPMSEHPFDDILKDLECA